MSSPLRYCFAFVLVAAFGTSGSQSRGAFIQIDNFQVEQDVGFLGIPSFIPDNSQAGPSSSILGGFRDMQTGGNADSFLETRLRTLSGELTFFNNFDTDGNGMIVWDGDDDPLVVNPAGLGGLDITANGGMPLNRISLELLSLDLPGLELTFEIFDVNSNVSALSTTIGNPILVPTTLDFFFTDFVGTADLTNVGAIKLSINGPPEIDSAFDLVEIRGPLVSAVPEPSTLIVWSTLGLTIGGFAWLRRRK